MDKERLAVLRQEVNEMYFKKEMSKREVIKQARVSNDFVTAWTKSPDQDFAMIIGVGQKEKGENWLKLTNRESKRCTIA